MFFAATLTFLLEMFKSQGHASGITDFVMARSNCVLRRHLLTYGSINPHFMFSLLFSLFAFVLVKFRKISGQIYFFRICMQVAAQMVSSPSSNILIIT